MPTIEDIMVNRNLDGIDLENAGNVADAVKLYEANVRDGFDGSHPYERLRVIYSREKRFEDAIRVCEAFISKRHVNNEPLKVKMRAFIEECRASE